MTTDMMVEGIHFDLRFVTPSQLGFKIVSVNVSDIYAMGGAPAFLLLDIAAGKATEGVFLASFLYGVRKALDFYRVDLVGGDLSSSKGGMAVSATVIGYAKRPVLRSGARPGDRLYVTGNLGDSGCGLEVLRRIKRTVPIEQEDCDGPLNIIAKLERLGIAWKDAAPLIRRHVMPEARNPRGLRNKATSMIDISDGLFIDLSRLCEESGVGVRVFIGKIPLSPGMRRTARALGIEPHSLATGGGEDYELLFTAPPRRKIALPCIGEITLSGMVVEGPGKREHELRPEGYTHWA
jgi:thiamine-monophosphate kinase